MTASKPNHGEKTVVFNTSKDEAWSPTNGYKKLMRKLKSPPFQCQVIINRDVIHSKLFENVDIFISSGPKEKFSAKEVDELHQYVQRGGTVIFCLGEGGDGQYQTNVNYFLEEYGISVNEDAVISTVFNKYFNPKETLVQNGILHQSFAKYEQTTSQSPEFSLENEEDETKGLPDADGTFSHMAKALEAVGASTFPIIFPFGSTLNTQNPAIPILCSGATAFPVQRPLIALASKQTITSHKSKSQFRHEFHGKLCVISSTHFLHDKYIQKEQNDRLVSALFQWSIGELSIDPDDCTSVDVSDFVQLPDTASSSEIPRACLEENTNPPLDAMSLYNDTLFKFDTSSLSDCIETFDHLSVQHEPLSLITPQLEVPLPPLRPALFPPKLPHFPPPALELFDLDEHFASASVRLAQLSNKCDEDDLEYYIKECADILQIARDAPIEKRTPNLILTRTLAEIVKQKQLRD